MAAQLSIAKQREVRVFISSTFRDMQDEREELIKYTFPELKRRCKERGVQLVEVDLRWGITEEQAERGETLPVCLEEIERCRPYFIGLLGERYGWVPDYIDPELIDMQPWLSEHRERSITELEIIYGILKKPELAEHAFFYFRDPGYLEKIPAERLSDFTTEDETSRKKLKSLKEKIRKSGVALRENYPDPPSLGRLVLEDLWDVIDKRYPEGSKPDPLSREAEEHWITAQSHKRVYISQKEYFDRLDAHVKGDDPPLVILGESGMGKSAIIANWALRYKEDNPDSFLILHFIGSTPQSADYIAILHRIMGELKHRFDIQEELPQTPDGLKEALPHWLAMAAAKDRVILILDGLNQLEDRDNAPDLAWLPDYFPPNIRVILSTLAGRSLDAIRKRNWKSLEISPLGLEQKRKLITEYLGQYRKSLNKLQLERIAEAPQCKNPLYLRTLLEELRVFGIHEKLDERITHYLYAQIVPELYRKVLSRLEKDYERERPDLVRDAMSFIWASRRGLYEDELMAMLGTDSSPLPRMIWSPLYLAMQEALLNRSGLIGFFHDYLRQAVYEKYIKDKVNERLIHLHLADYFSKQELGERKADELPWQLEKAEEWESLKDCITDPGMFLLFDTDTKRYELTGYWLSIGGRYDMVEEYFRTVREYEKSALSEEDLALALNTIASFLNLNAEYEGAEPLYRRALEIREKVLGPEHPNTAASLNNLAALLDNKGDYEGAEPLYRRALEIREKILGTEHPDTAQSLNNLAGLLQHKGDYEDAEPLYRKALEIKEKGLGAEHPDTALSLNNLAVLLYNKGDYDEAEPLYRRALGIRKKILGSEHPDTATSLNNLAGLLQHKGDYEDAEPLYRRALEICEKVLGTEHPDTAQSLNNLAELLRAKGDYEGAEPLYRRALGIYEKVLGSEHPDTATSLNNLAGLLQHKGDYEDAEPLYRRALEICEKVLGTEHPDTAQSLNNLAELLRAKGDYEGAEPLYRKALEITEKVLGPEHPDTAQSLNNLAELLRAKGDYEGAEPLYRKALEIYEKVLGPEHQDTATSLNNLAVLFHNKGDYEGAEPLYRRALEITEKVLGPEHPDTATSLNNLAELLRAKGDYEDAEPLYRRALEIYEKVLGPEHPNTATSLNNLAVLFHNKGDYEGAKPLYRRALGIREKVLGAEHPDTATNLIGLAAVLRAKGDYEGAELLYRRALEITEKVLGPEHPDTATSLNNLAELLRNKGDYEGAEPLYRRALEIREKVLGPEHPDTATSLNNLAVLLYNKGDYEDAELLLQRALRIYEKILGPNHPITITIRDNLSLLETKKDSLETARTLNDQAILLYNKGDYEKAERLYRQALEIRENTLGLAHPDTIQNFIDLAALLNAKGDFEEGFSFLLDTLVFYEKTLGAGHPVTQTICQNVAIFLGANEGDDEIKNDNLNITTTLFNLAMLLRDNDALEQAASIFKTIVADLEKTLSQTGSLIPDLLNILAICHNELAFHLEVPAQDWESAEHHYQRAIELFKKVPDPILTANSELNLQTMYHLSGQKVDFAKVKEATRILDEVGDPRAEKGHKLLG